jgi:programmed cell death protein 5
MMIILKLGLKTQLKLFKKHIFLNANHIIFIKVSKIKKKYIKMDDDLEKIRQKRMAELQQQSGGVYGGASAGGASQQQQQQEEMRRQQQDMKNGILSQVLTQEARARLNTLALTKPDKAQMVENHLIQLARSGQIMGKVFLKISNPKNMILFL